jgi:hypothetical protein
MPLIDWNTEFCWGKEKPQKKNFQAVVMALAWRSFIY